MAYGKSGGKRYLFNTSMELPSKSVGPQRRELVREGVLLRGRFISRAWESRGEHMFAVG